MTKTPRPPPDHGARERWRMFGPAIILTLAGFVVAYQFVEPAPPRRIAIATGGEEGAYYGFAERYAELLARDGITLEVRGTSGSIENLGLLAASESGIDVAFVQGGTGAEVAAPQLRSLGSTKVLPGEILVSARRWEKKGALRTILFYSTLNILFWLKFPLEKIKPLYGDLR